MKNILVLLVFSLLATNSYAVVSNYTANNPEAKRHVQDLGVDFENMSADDFLALTPKKYRQMTGEKLGFKNAVKLKVAQKMIKKQKRKAAKAAGADISEGLYIVLAFFGLGWLAMGLLDDFEGSNWIISLLLYFLLWLPGFIYTLVKKSDYY